MAGSGGSRASGAGGADCAPGVADTRSAAAPAGGHGSRGNGGALADGEHASLLSLAGIGFWQAWWMCASSTDAVMGPGGLGSVAMRVLLVTTLVAYLLVALLARRLAPYGSHRAALPATAASGVLGTALLSVATGEGPLAPQGAAGVAAVVVGLALASVSGALLLAMWGERWSTLSAGSVGRQLVCSFAAAFPIYLLVDALPRAAGAVLCALFMAASCLALLAARQEPSRAEPRAVPWPGAGPVAASAASLFALSVAFGACVSSAPQGDRPAQMAAAAVLMAVFALVMVAGRMADNPFAFYRPVVPAMACGLACAVLLSDSPAWRAAGEGAVLFGVYCLDMFVMFAACDLAFRTRRHPAAVFGGAMVAMRAGTLLGHELVRGAGGSLAQGAGALVTLSLVVLVGTAVFTEHRLRSWFSRGGRGTEDALRDVERRCAGLAGRAGLTPRERDVLPLMAQGLSISQVSERLGIASGTVKHHASNMYRKLDVYDRRELMDLVGRDDA